MDADNRSLQETRWDAVVPFEEVDPLVPLKDHKAGGCEAQEGCGASEILETHTDTHTQTRARTEWSSERRFWISQVD